MADIAGLRISDGEQLPQMSVRNRRGTPEGSAERQAWGGSPRTLGLARHKLSSRESEVKWASWTRLERQAKIRNDHS